MLQAGFGWKPGALGTSVPVTTLKLPAPFSESPLFAEHHIATGATATVSAGQTPCGCLTVYTKIPHSFNNDEFQLLQTVAHVIGKR